MDRISVCGLIAVSQKPKEQSVTNKFVALCMQSEKLGETAFTLTTSDQTELVLFIRENALLLKKARDFMCQVKPEPAFYDRLILVSQIDQCLNKL